MDTALFVKQLDAAAAQQNFGDYCAFVHDRPLYPHQLAWAQELQKPASRTLIVAPPGSLKSTLCAYYVEWCIGRDPDDTTLYLMNTAAQSMRQVMSIEDTIEHNTRYRAVFPEVQPDKERGWSKDTLFVKRKDTNNPYATLYGTGIDGPYQGVHINRIIIDDPTDQQDIISEATMTQQRQRVKGVMVDRLKPGGNIFAILTRWGIMDLTSDLQQIGLRLIENPAEGKYLWGDLLCPELFPRQELSALKAQKGEGMYAMTYMCNPSILARQTSYFDVDAMTAMLDDCMEPREMVRGLISLWRKPVVAGRYILGADTAWGKTGSFGCAAVSDFVTGEQVAELHGRPHPDDMAQECFNLHVMYNHAYTGLEIAGDGQERDGESVVVVDKVVELFKQCGSQCRDKLFYADYNAAKPSKPGWQTDGKTRPPMLGELAEAVRNRQMVVRSRAGVGEMMTFIRNEKGRAEAAPGAYDDRVMAYAIMWKMRKYAKFSIISTTPTRYSSFAGRR